MPSKLSKAERTILTNGLDMTIASLARKEGAEKNPQVKEIRQKEIQEVVILKNKLATLELEL